MKNIIASFTLMMMLFSIIILPVTAQGQETEVQRATEDALRDVEQDVSKITWGISGFFCSVFSVAYAYIGKPPVPASRFIGKSAEYVTFYTDAYHQEVRKQRGQAAVIGCLAGSIFSTITYYLSDQSQ